MYNTQLGQPSTSSSYYRNYHNRPHYQSRQSSNQTLMPYQEEQIGPGKIYRSPKPTVRELEYIQNTLKVNTIIQLCFDSEFGYERQTIEKEYASRELTITKYCIPDFQVPKDVNATWELVDKIILETRSGNNVLIHCVGGLGRTGLILALIAMKTFGYEPTQAVEWVRKFVPRAVETPTQHTFLGKCQKEGIRKEEKSLELTVTSHTEHMTTEVAQALEDLNSLFPELHNDPAFFGSNHTSLTPPVSEHESEPKEETKATGVGGTEIIEVDILQAITKEPVKEENGQTSTEKFSNTPKIKFNSENEEAKGQTVHKDFNDEDGCCYLF